MVAAALAEADRPRGLFRGGRIEAGEQAGPGGSARDGARSRSPRLRKSGQSGKAGSEAQKGKTPTSAPCDGTWIRFENDAHKKGPNLCLGGHTWAAAIGEKDPPALKIQKHDRLPTHCTGQFRRTKVREEIQGRR